MKNVILVALLSLATSAFAAEDQSSKQNDFRLHFLSKTPYSAPVSKENAVEDKWEGTSAIEKEAPSKNNLHMIGKQPFRSYK